MGAPYVVSFDCQEVALPGPDPSLFVMPVGAFAGVSNGAWLIAGGQAISSDTVSLQDAIHVCYEARDGAYQLLHTAARLPMPTAGGETVATTYGLACMGGRADPRDAFLLEWHMGDREIFRRDLPDLPVSCTELAGGQIGSQLLIAGVDSVGQKYFWSLELGGAAERWQSLPTWPGPTPWDLSAGIQVDGEQEALFLFVGGGSHASWAVYKYDPGPGRWQVRSSGPPQGAQVSFQRQVLPVGASHLLVLVPAASTARTDTYDLHSYHTITDVWAHLGQIPGGAKGGPVTWWDGHLVTMTQAGEAGGGPTLRKCAITPDNRFGRINYLVVVIYLLILVVMGVLLSRNQKTTEDFFKGGNRIPAWAAGLSIFGTQLSAITFMAIPAKTYATDWLYFILMMTIIMVAPIVIRYFLPFYRRFRLTTAYEYLELRFNYGARLLGSLMYVFLQLGRLGIVLLLPSLALSVVTGIDVNTCILAMGVLSIIYTVLGGIEAVIWTDVMQVVVLLGGALLSLVILGFRLDLPSMMAALSEADKLRVFDFKLDLSHPTLWVVLIGGLATNLIQYGSDQTVIQRYLTTKDEKAAAKSIRIGAWMALPSALIFFSLGSLLYVFYKMQPEALNPTLTKTDAIFPWFIVQQLPDGISGLLIAAIFAASMSSLDSSMNSVSTVVTTDYIRRFWPIWTEGRYLRSARLITVVVGIIGTAMAIWMAGTGLSSLWDQFNMIIGLFAGGLGGVFLLGIFTSRSNGPGVVIGLLLSGILQYLVKEHTDVHLLLYAFTGMASSLLLGYVFSWAFAHPSEEKLSYTFRDLSKS